MNTRKSIRLNVSDVDLYYLEYPEKMNTKSEETGKTGQESSNGKVSCKDSICNDPKLILGSYVKGPNNKFVESGLKS